MSTLDSKPEITQLCRDTAASLNMDWLTHAPYQMSEMRLEKVGFANNPIVYVMVVCPSAALKSVIPVVRQFIFREVEAAGIENEILELIPYVQSGRRQKFANCNEHSETVGRNMVGTTYRISFRIKEPFLGYFEWGGWCKTEGKIPERKRTKGE